MEEVENTAEVAEEEENIAAVAWVDTWVAEEEDMAEAENTAAVACVDTWVADEEDTAEEENTAVEVEDIVEVAEDTRDNEVRHCYDVRGQIFKMFNGYTVEKRSM
ncbi:uncharacterized protein LOC129221305 [Uloborus diversus]|uniref:uncharacterized protein LOC129221235 n=1 Tax=Uloborus diversus TaxID=327109 RepID=UPI0024095FB5|nr:uncharacterized protein LOC129221235 [Uloborus diversus]XP_054711739.1 uncharacterized protein LOC129221305 [Uloborus diversus]